MTELADLPAPVASYPPRAELPPHMHLWPYAAVILSGSYEEIGSAGRHRVSAGDVLIHGVFDAHCNRISARGAQILNLALPALPVSPRRARLADPDLVARLATHDSRQAAGKLLASLTDTDCTLADWPDALAQVLQDGYDGRLSDWAAAHHLAPETLSRGFAKVFGVTPAAFRWQARDRLALRLIAAGNAALAAIAAEAGFADQAHMTRCVFALTGATPQSWHRQFRSRRGLDNAGPSGDAHAAP
jgi:AraC-like DNA-binding protein